MLVQFIEKLMIAKHDACSFISLQIPGNLGHEHVMLDIIASFQLKGNDPILTMMVYIIDPTSYCSDSADVNYTEFRVNYPEHLCCSMKQL